MPPRQPFTDEDLGELMRGLQEPQNDDGAIYLEDDEYFPEEFEVGDDGEVREVAPEDDLMPVTSSDDFRANLAEYMDDKELSRIAQDLIERIEEDIKSREPWSDRFQRGMEMMGLVEDEIDDGPFPGASTAVMPVIAEAVTQFWARALAEQVPSEGPAKSAILGKPNSAQYAKAERVASFMNHEMMFLDRSWYTDHSRMLFALPTSGSTFKKTYRDETLGRNVSIYVSAEDFITNHAFTDLDTAPRYTHRIWKTRNEVRRMQVAGIYLDVDLSESLTTEEDLPDETRLKMEVSDYDVTLSEEEDGRHEIYEVHCELDLPGFEDVSDSGQRTGIGLPYIVTIDKESEKVLAIYRAWKEADPLKRRRVIFTKYDFLPGPGFYGLGLWHMIGGLQMAATGALRAIIDGAATASLQGGFMTKDASIKGDSQLIVEPGVWKQVDASLEDLQKAFFTPPFNDPSPVLFQVMGLLVERAEKYTATTEMMVGAENSKNMPVGSTLALLEQGGRVFSAIHRGLHKSLGEELRQRFDLIQEYMPIEGYPYDVEGAHEGIMAQDFSPGISIVPVSDPNIFTQAQRIAVNQTVYELATANPDLLDRKAAVKRLLEGMKVPEYEELLLGEGGPPMPMDPISEIQALLRGEPVQAYPEQDHVAHLQHYSAFAQNPQFGANPQIAEQVGPGLMSLIAQRLAYAWATHARALGAPAGYLPPPMGDPNQQDPAAMGGPPGMAQGMPGMDGMPPQGGPQQPQVPPEQIAQIAAQIAPQMANVPGLPSPEGQADAARAEAEAMQLQAKAQESQAKVQSLQAKTQSDVQAKQADMALKAQEAQQKMWLERAQAEAKVQIEEIKAMAKIEIERLDAALKAQQAESQKQAAMMQTYMRAREAEKSLQDKIITSDQEQGRKDQEAAITAALKASESERDQRRKDEESRVRQQAMKTQAKAKRKKSTGGE